MANSLLKSDLKAFPQRAHRFAQQEENLVQLLGVFGIEVAAGLVGEDDFGGVNQGAGHGHALLFAAAHFAGLVAGMKLHIQYYLCTLG